MTAERIARGAALRIVIDDHVHPAELRLISEAGKGFTAKRRDIGR